MPTQKKVENVALLSEKLGQAQLTIVADYRGLTVADMQNLRGQRGTCRGSFCADY